MIYFLLLILMIFLGILSKKSWIVFFVLYILTFIVAMYSGEGFDRGNLDATFNMNQLSANASDRSMVFYSIMFAFSEAGYSFFEFREINFLIWSFFILLFVIRFSKHPTYVFACSVLFPIMSFTSQMRNGLGVAFLYLAYYSLLSIKGKLKIPIFIIFLLVAFSIHYIFTVYLLSLFALINCDRKALIKTSVAIMVLLWFLFVSGVFSSITNTYLSSYYSDYFDSDAKFSIYLHVPLIIGLIVNTAFTTRCEEYLERRKSLYTEDEATVVRFVSRLNIIFMSIIPLLFISGSFYRIFQNIYILSLISVSITSSHYIINKQHQGEVYRIVYAIFYLIVGIFYLYWQGGFIDSMKTIKL